MAPSAWSEDRAVGDEGVTLPEITLALALVSIVALAVAGLLVASARNDVGRTDTATIRLETTIALDRLVNEVREADRVGVSAAGPASSVLHLDDPSGGWIEWRLGSGGLERRSFDGALTSEWARQAPGLTTESAGGPFVLYHDRSGAVFDTPSHGTANWSTCTASVTAIVRMPEYGGDDVLTRTTTIRRRALLEQAC